jgi:hypothetical protein
VILNGHEYVACQARKAGIGFIAGGKSVTWMDDIVLLLCSAAIFPLSSRDDRACGYPILGADQQPEAAVHPTSRAEFMAVASGQLALSGRADTERCPDRMGDVLCLFHYESRDIGSAGCSCSDDRRLHLLRRLYLFRLHTQDDITD